MPLIRPERPSLRDVSPVTIGIAVVLVAGVIATFGVLRSVSDHGARPALAATPTTARSAQATSKPAANAKATASTTTTTTWPASAGVAASSGTASTSSTSSASSASSRAKQQRQGSSLAAQRASVRAELRRVTRDLALVLRAERALKAAVKLQPSATVEAAIKQLDARITALRKQEASLQAKLRSLRATPKPGGKDDDKDLGKDRDRSHHRSMTLTAAAKPQHVSAASHGRPSVTDPGAAPSKVTRVRTVPKAKGPAKVPGKAPAKAHKPAPVPVKLKGPGKVHVCPLASSGARVASIATCPPPLAMPPCGRPLVLMPWRCRPPCSWPRWRCHPPSCGPVPRFNGSATATGNSVPSWCWPWPPVPPCGGILKARAAGTQAIMCPLAPATRGADAPVSAGGIRA